MNKKFSQSKLFLKHSRPNPIVLVDIGARGGISPKWSLLKKNIKVLGFEPDPEECKKLNKGTTDNQTYFPVALSDKEKYVNLHITKNPACCSFFLPNLPFVKRFPNGEDLQVVNSTPVKCNSLDNILRKNNIQDIDFLKIDTQGSELQILQGAKETLKNSVFGIDVEVEFLPQYSEQPLFSEIDDYLKKLGFSLFDLDLARLKRKKYPKAQSKEQVLWAHAVYFKDFLSNQNIPFDFKNLNKALKSIALAEIHQFSDFALELLDFYHNQNIIKENICGEAKKLLLKNKLLPEYKLFKTVRSAAANYLKSRAPFIYRVLSKKL